MYIISSPEPKKPRLSLMPLFAFVNAGVVFKSGMLENAFTSSLTWGIIFGLFFGKQIGILLATWILLKFVFKNMPRYIETRKILFGVALLCGIGFTMSLFITNLSFPEGEKQEFAKIGVLVISLVCGLLGYLVLRYATSTPEKIEEDNMGMNE